MIATNDRTWVALAFLIGAAVMAVGGIAELFLGVKAERASLEDIAKPLTAEEAERGALPGVEDDTATAREASGESEDERRWRERDERRMSRERAGSRRYRPGPDPTGAFYSPGMMGTSLHSRTASPSLLDREIDAIANALAEGGEMRREELARRVGARRWGPGRFQRALEEALADGRAMRLSRTTFGPTNSRS
jgi:hypothetical protein